jgi:hypothetical protein
MAKRVGKAYDPAIRMTEAGSRLYQTWRKIRRNPHCEEWLDFQTFYTWAMSVGYKLGDWLQLIDSDKPYAPDNVVWYSPRHTATPPPDYVAWKHDWNTAVNRIRKDYGMPPLEGTNYGD